MDDLGCNAINKFSDLLLLLHRLEIRVCLLSFFDQHALPTYPESYGKNLSLTPIYNLDTKVTSPSLFVGFYFAVSQNRSLALRIQSRQYTFKRNIWARGKAISITDCERVSVAFVIQHAMRMGRIACHL